VYETVMKMAKPHEGRIVTVEGQKDQKTEIFLFTLSTCMWCNLGKKWLRDMGYRYSYLDVDTILLEEKNKLKSELGELIGEQPRFPFLVTDTNKWHSGYDTSVWEEILSEEK
jgi:glutaredoxin